MERVQSTMFGLAAIQVQECRMQSQYFVGIDIAADSFTAAAGTTPWKLLVPPAEFPNAPDGFQAFQEWLQQHRLNPAHTLVCMEATGVYGEALGYWLVAQGYPLAVEPPLKVKRAFSPHGPKNDAVDSCQIAEYACRYVDELNFWQPRPETLEQMRVLLTTREQLVAQKTAHQNALHALHRKVIATPLAEQVHQQLTVHLQEQIRRIEQELRRLIDQDPSFRRTLLLLLTVPGVGLLLASHLLILAYSSNQPLEPRHLAGYIGIAPYEHLSGQSVRRRTRSRGYGPAALRNLLRLAARSVSTHQPSFRQYYQRKLAEGKLKPVAFNNVANKLLKIICAVLRSGTPYIPDYRSVNPLLLQEA
jgi:transposase